jgi:hypothetical protein
VELFGEITTCFGEINPVVELLGPENKELELKAISVLYLL